MASPTIIHLTPADTGVFKFQPQDEETAAVASRVLQKNHDVMFFLEVSYPLLTYILTGFPHLLQSSFWIPQSHSAPHS
jgi:hypothetical protein